MPFPLYPAPSLPGSSQISPFLMSNPSLASRPMNFSAAPSGAPAGAAFGAPSVPTYIPNGGGNFARQSIAPFAAPQFGTMRSMADYQNQSQTPQNYNVPNPAANPAFNPFLPGAATSMEPSQYFNFSPGESMGGNAGGGGFGPSGQGPSAAQAAGTTEQDAMEAGSQAGAQAAGGGAGNSDTGSGDTGDVNGGMGGMYAKGGLVGRPKRTVLRRTKGGPVPRTAGPPGRDTVPARVSNGEFVMQRSATADLGNENLSLLNQVAQLPPQEQALLRQILHSALTEVFSRRPAQ